MRQIPTRLNNDGTGSAIIRCGNKPVAEMLAYTSSERDDTAAEFIERWNAFEPDGEVAQLRAENERLRAALEKIKTARDHHSEEGIYPEKIHIQYQGCFDDWAADLAEYAIAQSGAPARETSRAARAALGKGAV